MAGREFKIRAVFEGRDELSPTVQRVEGRLSRLSSFIQSRFVVTLGDVANILRTAVGRAFTDSIAAAIEQETAIRKLDAALAKFGPNAAALSQALQAQAVALQNTTKFSDDAVEGAQALLATYGVAADQLELATQASVDLASALGIDLASAAQQVGATTSGMIRGVAKLVPELKGLSKEALASGQGITLLADALAGRAAAEADTFAGRLAILNNKLGELQETVGQTATESEGLKVVLEALGVAVDQLNVSLASGEGEEIANRFGVLGKSVLLVRDGVTDLATRYVAANKAQSDAAKSALEFERAVRGILAATDPTVQAIQREVRALRDLREAQGDAVDASDKFLEQTEALGVLLEGNVNAAFREHTALLEQADGLLRSGEITRQDYERIERAIAEAQAEANQQLGEQLGLLDDTAESFDTSAEAANRYSESVRGVRDAARELQREQQEVNDAQSKFSENLLGGRSSFSTISGGTFTTVRSASQVVTAPSGRRSVVAAR